MFRKLLPLLLVLTLLAAACGSDDGSEVDSAGVDVAASGSDPIPVEPDGGIGDGAEPLPGAQDEPADEGTWHGEQVAITNCPGVEWKRVQAREFSFSVPADFVEQDVQPIDSEVGVWRGGNNIEATYDYGWYSGSISAMAGAENEPVVYAGIAGEQTVVRGGDQEMVGIYFGEIVESDRGQWDKLSLLVRYPDPADEIIGRCIVGSIEFNA